MESILIDAFQSTTTDLKFSYQDPKSLYENLSEIGAGNFGKVYSANEIDTNSLVAIKKIQITSAKDKEKISEIKRELEVLRIINHPNCICLKNLFVESTFVWIVMEFCVGSIRDLMNMIGAFSEIQISYICNQVIHALAYIHSLSFIHRDIKAENILISSTGTIKLADFGSSSMKTPANTFIGTPFWMAPEVILAMDDGIYDCKVDIWSMGITSYELGEKSPPLFHLNGMSALYHIAQNDAPQLINEKWSKEYRDFTNSMLQKESKDRPSAAQMTDHSFLKICQGCSFVEIIQKCSVEAQIKNETALNNFLRVLNQNKSPSDDSESISDPEKSKDDLVEDFTQISLVTKSTTKTTGTIKTIDAIKEEENKKQEVGHIQLRDYQALRQENSRKLLALDQKLTSEIANIKRSQQKSLELLKCTNSKAIKFITDKYDSEIERQKRKFKNDLKKMLKEKVNNATERRNIYNSLLNVDVLSSDSSSFYVSVSSSSSPAGTLAKSDVNLDILNLKRDQPQYSEDCEKIVRENITKLKDLHAAMLLEKQNLMISQRQYIEKIEIADNNIIIQKEFMKFEKMFQKKEKLLIKLHEYETQAQQDYVNSKLADKKREHLQNLKTRPRDIKVIEAKLLKAYKNDVKIIHDSCKTKLKTLLDKHPKEDHAKIKNKMDLEKIELMILKKKEMENQIASSVQENTKFEVCQTQEYLELENLLHAESQSLANYQKSQLENLKKTKMNDLQCIHQKFEEYEKEIKKNAAKDIDIIKANVSVDLEKVSKPFEFSFDQFMLKNLSIEESIEKPPVTSYQITERPYASLYFSKKAKKKSFPQF